MTDVPPVDPAGKCAKRRDINADAELLAVHGVFAGIGVTGGDINSIGQNRRGSEGSALLPARGSAYSKMNVATRQSGSPESKGRSVLSPTLILLAGVIVAVVLSPAAQAAALYLSPNGSDSNSGASPASAWKTFAYAIPRLKPGDTLLLGDGTYTSANSGYLNVVCGSNAANGLPAQPITVRAINERKAFLDGDGTARPVYIFGCSNWVLEGLRAESGDYSYETGDEAGSVFVIKKSSNVTLRRNIGEKPNRYLNAHPYKIVASTNALLEENEAYTFHRHGISLYISSFITLRRNYSNPRGYPVFAGYNFGPQEGITIYLSTDSIIENNVVEGSEAFSNTGSRNRFLGNITFNAAIGFALGHHCCVDQIATDNIYINNVALSNNNAFLTQSESKAIYLNNTAIDNKVNGFKGNNKYGYPDSLVSWTVHPNIIVQNGLSVGNGLGGFVFDDTSLYSLLVLDTLDAFGNNNDYSNGTGNRTNSVSADPLLGSCKVYIPANSPLKGAGADRADIGANVLYRYVDGILMNRPLWDPTTGAFPCGAVVAGVNDSPQSSCFDVNQRLNVKANGCAFPAGYGQSSSDTPLNPVDLVAAFGFGEGAGIITSDSSGNANMGIISGTAWTNKGRFGNALSFDGINSYMTAGISKLPAANTPQTISWWMNFPSNPTEPQSIIVLANPVQKSAVQAGFKNSRVAVWQYGGTVLVSTPTPSASVWHSYAYTFDGTTHRLYIDGLPVDSSKVPPQSAAVTNLELGRWPGYSNEYFRGSLDEVRIYNRVLNQIEIQRDLITAVGSAGSAGSGGLPTSSIFFPQVAVGGGYSTVFTIPNTDASTFIGNLILTDQRGNPLSVNFDGPMINLQAGSSGDRTNITGSSFPLAIPAGGTISVIASSLSTVDSSQSGWGKVESLSGSFGGVATFQLSQGGYLKTIAGVLASQPTEFATIPVDNDESLNRFTGFAVANTGNEDITIKLRVLDQAGKVVDSLNNIPELSPLRPRRQVAKFLHEYIQARAKFRGSMVLSAESGKKFSVVALLQDRGQFTALPVIPAMAPNIAGEALPAPRAMDSSGDAPTTTLFPHVAIGGGYSTLFTFLNTGSTPASGNLILTDQHGNSLDATLSAQSFGPQFSSSDQHFFAVGPFALDPIPPGGTQFVIATSLKPGDAANTGWARVEGSGGTLSGVATFRLASSAGVLQTIVGVLSGPLVASATIPIDDDVTQNRFTGYAIANPSNKEIRIKMLEVSSDGRNVTTLSPVTLGPLNQIAAFFFQDPIQDPKAARKFNGSAVLIGEGGATFSVVALVQNQGLFSAIPVIPGNAPNIGK